MKNLKKKSDDREAIHELVYREIRRSLMLGAFSPGEKVSLRSLADGVGTSLTPVRGAVSRLIAEGAFETLPNRSVATPTMNIERFDEITHWRIQLECAAGQMAASNVTSKLLKTLESINRKMVKEVKGAADRRTILEKNYDFHFAVYRASGSAVLLPMIESLWLQVGPFSFLSLDSPTDLWSANHHEHILEGLRKGDPEMVADSIEDDISETAKFLKGRNRFGQQRLRRVVPPS